MKKMNSKISFLIVSYNEAEYLENAIESCIKQNVENYEIIIGDDGSDDGSLAIIEEYAKKYPEIIKYFVSDREGIILKNVIASLRVSAVIERALEMASGEYCVVLSGDDYFYETSFFKNAISFLDNNLDYVAYVGRYEKVWEDRPVVSDSIVYPRKLYWARKYVHLSTFVFRKKVFDEGNFLQRFCDDTGLQYSLAFSGKWKYEQVIMFAYRQRSGSIMHTANPLQNYIVELMIFQDVLCKGFLYRQSTAKYNRALQYVFKHRDELKEEKYKKFLLNCEKYDHNILEMIQNYEDSNFVQKLSFRIWMNYGKLLETEYRVIGRIYNLVYKMRG